MEKKNSTKRRGSFCFFTSMGRDNYEVIVYRRARSLRESGYDVTFMVNDTKGEEYIEDTKVVSTGVSSGSYLRRIFIAPFKTFRKLRQINADYYQTYSVDLLLVCLLLKIIGKKVIFDLREGHPYTYYLKSKKPHWINYCIVSLMAIWMKFCLRKLDATIVTSEGIERYCLRWGVPNVSIIGNFPVVNKDYSLSYEDYIKREDRVIYYGSIYTISRQEVFMDALSRIPNVHYFLAGKFEYQYYKEQITQHSYWEKVEFIDGFQIHELPSFFKKSTISNVLRDFSKTSSPNGSMGIIKLFESMEAGLPIICSNVPVYQKLLSEYPCGLLVDVNDSKQIEDAVRYLIEHKEEAYKMGQIGRKAVIEKYSWDALSSKYIGIIESI